MAKIESIWSDTVKIPHRPPLAGNMKVEAAVIGAGMAGILTAYYLKEQGIDVIVLEADRIASGQTKNTTAKITSQHGLIYHSLIKRGRVRDIQRAKLYARANEEAIRAYGELVEKEKIECHFKKLSSYLYTTDSSRKKELEAEARTAASLGIEAHFTEETGLPFEVAGAVRFDNQAQFHPLEFIKTLSEKVMVYEKTKVLRVKGHTIFTNRGTVTAKHIIFTVHYPFINVPGFFFTRLHQERSHCLGLSGLKETGNWKETSGWEETGGWKENGEMYYSIDENGLSFRWFEDILLLGGGSHRTGKNRKGGKYGDLTRAAKRYYPDCRIVYQWSAQDCVSHDKIPFIGKFSVFRPYWHVATGFKKWGMTSSMVSALIIRDRICGMENPYEPLFTPQRFFFLASFKSLLADLGESAKGLAKGSFHLPFKARRLPAGHGGIMRIGFTRYACYKDESGKLHKISAKCPHLGCELEWNPDELSWDCPCHGSRFDCDGNLIDNPANRGLGIKG